MKKFFVMLISFMLLFTVLSSFNVVGAKPMPKAVSITGEITTVSVGTQNKKEMLALETKESVYVLSGKIGNLSNYAGSNATLRGHNYLGAHKTQYFHVNSFEIIKDLEPKQEEIVVPDSEQVDYVYEISEKDNGGYVYVKKGDLLKLMLESNPSTGYRWLYDEKADEKILKETGYEFISSTNDKMIVGAGGTEVWTFEALESGTTVIYLSYSRPWESANPLKHFKVKIIVDDVVITPPQPTPQPTPYIDSKVHTIISDKPLYFSGKNADNSDISQGYTTVSWCENSGKAFFNSTLIVGKSIYQFELEKVISTSSSSIKGTFNIKKDGVTVAESINGELYGLSLSIGDYFKFYSEDTTWHMSAYITNRMDY